MASPSVPDLPGDVRPEGRQIRDLADRLIEEMQALRRLEGRARDLPIGSLELERVSQEIAERVRGVFMLSARQHAMAAEGRERPRTASDRDASGPTHPGRPAEER